MKRNNSGMSIILAMGLVMIIILTAQFLLSYMIPFSKATKGIENASIAYYIAYSGIEEAMWFKSQNEIGSETGIIMPNTNQGLGYIIEATGSTIPPILGGNSDFNTDRNKINANDPIQLILYGSDLKKITDINFDNTKFKFFVPNLNGTALTFSGGTDDIINWQLSWSGNTVNAIDDNRIKGNKITDSDTDEEIHLGNLIGRDLNGVEDNITDWWTNSIGIDDLPVLKLSIVNKIEHTSGKLPYLEYNIKVKNNSNNNLNIPTRYTRVSTHGKSYGYQKNLKFRIPQITTNQAFDFTVFQ